MAAGPRRSGSSTSSFNSSLYVPNVNSASLHIDPTSTSTPNSAASALTAELPSLPTHIDLGAPGYEATIKIGDITLFLGPWDIVGSSSRRVVWPTSYAGEMVEHFLPADHTAEEAIPYTLHAQHQRFTHPRELELRVSFRKPHQIRYTKSDGHVEFEGIIDVNYEFSTLAGSTRFQGDVRRRDLIDFYDIDVVWSDVHKKTDGYGKIKGLGTIQRIKLWRDRYSAFHTLTVYANHLGQGQWQEFSLHDFDREFGKSDSRRRRIQLATRSSRRDSLPDAGRGRRSLASSLFRGRHPSLGSSSKSTSRSSPSPQNTLEIRFLAIQFSRNDGAQAPYNDDYSRFIEAWNAAQDAESGSGATFPINYAEHQVPAGQLAERSSMSTLPSVMEPADTLEDEEAT